MDRRSWTGQERWARPGPARRRPARTGRPARPCARGAPAELPGPPGPAASPRAQRPREPARARRPTGPGRSRPLVLPEPRDEALDADERFLDFRFGGRV